MVGIAVKQSFEQEISRWFERTGGGGLVLPNGWFGRPFDNIHELTYIKNRPTKLILELDERLLLVFTEVETVVNQGNELHFENYVQCVFDWQEYESKVAHISSYNTGAIKIVAPPGR